MLYYPFSTNIFKTQAKFLELLKVVFIFYDYRIGLGIYVFLLDR